MYPIYVGKCKKSEMPWPFQILTKDKLYEDAGKHIPWFRVNSCSVMLMSEDKYKRRGKDLLHTMN